MTTPTAREVVTSLVHAVVNSTDTVADFYAPELTIEMPFGAPLYPASQQTGREQLRAQIVDGTKSRRYTKVDNVVIHETTDPEVVIVEYEVHGDNLDTETPFVLPLLMIITVRDGLIVHSRDYSNAVAGAVALGRVPELLTALGEL